ncbi:MAG: Sec-independent protein translocase protein TatB [Rhizobium sp.]|nr:Sec-independent protein translocase protein TatB [Rhizobium sp.]MCZ8349014.1 Sec-independent protein translocase protein TatB [Rhizobium sp.]
MLDIGWTELLVIAVILIVVVGPKDLPPMIRAFGKMTKRLRQTAGEFRAQFDEALREAELEDIKRSVDDVRSLNPANSIREALNPLRQMGQDIRSDLERSTRFEPKSDAEDEGVENSILPELPFGLDEPPQELRPAAQQPAQPAPASQPVQSAPAAGTAPAQAPVPAAVDPTPVAVAAAAAPVVAATAPAPASPAPAAAVPAKAAKASGGKSAAKTAAPAKPAAKTAKSAPATAAVEAPKAKAVRAKSSATKTAEPAPAADIKVKATPKTRKMKSEDRA